MRTLIIGNFLSISFFILMSIIVNHSDFVVLLKSGGYLNVSMLYMYFGPGCGYPDSVIMLRLISICFRVG